MQKIVVATSSVHKLREIRQMTAGSPFAWLSLADIPFIEEPIEDGRTFAENARKKALHYSRVTSDYVLADDSGLEVSCLNGAPGVDSAYYAGRPRDDAANNRKLVAALEGVALERRSARFRCVMVLARAGEVLLESSGEVEGLIVDQPRGENGFGYDPHFLIPEFDRTTAELASEQKNLVSHRGRALRAMLEKLQQFFHSSAT
jgi:XTP/dITP diphosphohydrolase